MATLQISMTYLDDSGRTVCDQTADLHGSDDDFRQLAAETMDMLRQRGPLKTRPSASATEQATADADYDVNIDGGPCPACGSSDPDEYACAECASAELLALEVG